ncbi:MAG: exosortase system-associated protein, TIGR04073 family [Methylococcaceae bacterium]|nr:exosortase system-associated protein, TIGR04073 family [Methylococcaceae bacterium]
MNKNKLFTACVLCGTLMASQSANADEHNPGYLAGFTSRVSQGFANTTTSFIEIPKNVVNITHDQNILLGSTWGVLRGVAHTVTRTVLGVAELIASPIPTREFISPPYVWDRFSEDTRYFGGHFPGYWTHYGPLDHGYSDTLDHGK